jgi:hypothetical protein
MANTVTQAQAAGIQKRKATTKKARQAPKVAKKGGRKKRVVTQPSASSPRVARDDDHNNVESEEEDLNEPLAIDDRSDDDDPLAGVTDPLQRMQIKVLMAEEKRKTADERRKQELHDLDVRQREAQMTGAAGPSASAAIVSVDDLGESLLSPVERQQVLSFSTIPKKHVIAIARNTFDPGNLPYLESLTLDDNSPDVTISFEDGKLKQSKSVGKASAIKSPPIWTKNFITYVRVVSIFHGVQHPKIVDKLLEFHNTIMELAQTYDWQKAVLPLALLLHRTGLHKGFADLDAWDPPTSLIDRYCRAHPRPAPPGPSSTTPSKRVFEEHPTNKSGVTCTNFNFRSCTTDRCRRDHKCSLCGGSHSAKLCKAKAKEEKA